MWSQNIYTSAFSREYIHLDHQEVHIFSPHDLLGRSKTEEKKGKKCKSSHYGIQEMISLGVLLELNTV